MKKGCLFSKAERFLSEQVTHDLVTIEGPFQTESFLRVKMSGMLQLEPFDKRRDRLSGEIIAERLDGCMVLAEECVLA